MRRLLFVPLALLAACAQPKTKIEYADGMDLGRYRRIGVMPFTDQKGRGREIGQAITQGLPARGFQVVDTGSLEAVFARFKPDAEMGLGITELTEIKQSTHAQAILSGAVAPDGTQAALILVDTDLGDEIFKATLWPAKKGAFKDSAEIADQALHLFADLPSKKK